ncbi:GreA/GreB family elongation factor [Mycobacterium paraffinicum]|uniref:GreA/GreB family elongation factor n=1 Tax=Mycobacterium paraffinicum TaxID=53378 RepID=UPI0021F32D4E|nr:GreA/GreB family elongation factor [Mycobacterium paraffinicum]MCV7309183.1 GreA/GreB family elongation factor [Mycobacterium paraffinicum]
MTRCAPVSITPQHRRRLQDELAVLRSRRSIEVPDDAMDYGGHRAARPAARGKRIREIEDLLATAVVRDDPARERIAGPGMVVTIRYDASGETETLLLGRRGAEGADIHVYSMASPLGRCIAGARPGEQRIYAIPHDTGRLVTLLKAVPYRAAPRDAQARSDCGRQTRGNGVSDRQPLTTIDGEGNQHD